MNKKNTLLFFLVIFTLPLFAQRKEKAAKPNREKIHLVYMTDESILKGKIHSKTKRAIEFTLAGDSSKIVINRKSVKRLKTNISAKSHNKYLFYRGRFIKKEGYYGTINLSTTWFHGPLGDGRYYSYEPRWFDVAIVRRHLHASFGKILNETFTVGVGTGIDYFTSPFFYSNSWSTTRRYSFIPIYAEVRGYHFKKKISPYYNFAFGVGIANQHLPWYSYTSGLFIKPALGLRFASKSRLSYFLEIDYRIQKTKAQHEIWGLAPNATVSTILRHENEDLTLQKLGLTFGLLF